MLPRNTAFFSLLSSPRRRSSISSNPFCLPPLARFFLHRELCCQGLRSRCPYLSGNVMIPRCFHSGKEIRLVMLGNQRRRKQFIQRILIEYHVRKRIFFVYSFVQRREICQFAIIIQNLYIQFIIQLSKLSPSFHPPLHPFLSFLFSSTRDFITWLRSSSLALLILLSPIFSILETQIPRTILCSRRRG